MNYNIEQAAHGFIASRNSAPGEMSTRYAFSTAKELCEWLYEQLRSFDPMGNPK